MKGVIDAKAKSTKLRFVFLYLLAGLIVCLFLFYIFFLRGFCETFKEDGAIESARTLGVALFQYAQDNNGKYPEGKSSTEIFQRLFDGGYLTFTNNGKEYTDLDSLYYPMPGKVRAPPGTKILKPENICWDATCCLDEQSPDKLPLIFLTGYKVTYQAGASAVPLPRPTRSWSDWWQGRNYPTRLIAVSDVSDSRQIKKLLPDGTIPNFISTDFDPKGKTYHQLTPDGELPP